MTIIEKYKEKYNDFIEVSFKIYDTKLIGYKSFDYQTSIIYNIVTGYYQCWIYDSQLISNEEKKVKEFLEL